MFIFKLVLSTYNHTKKVVEPKLKAKLVYNNVIHNVIQQCHTSKQQFNETNDLFIHDVCVFLVI